MADRAGWDAATRHQRHQAAEPPTQAQRDELTLTPGKQIPETNQLIKDLAVQRQR